MINRNLTNLILNDSSLRQMAFIAGPRQIGKTTLVKELLKTNNCSKLYYNWDISNIRRRHREDNYFYIEDINVLKRDGTKKIYLCFDEIHKIKGWKNVLKGYFDETENKIKTLITGSARMDLFRKSGDSLAGRYFLYHLLPVTLCELAGYKNHIKDELSSAIDFIELRLARNNICDFKNIELLLNFSGFPEPLVKAKRDFHKKWQISYMDRLVYEDIKELSHIQDLEKAAMLIDILPNKIGSLLSINSLSEDLEVNFRTVKSYLKVLELVYIVFFIKPYTKSIARTIKKEPKVYLFDWTRIGDFSKRFENYVACELLSLISFCNDAGIDNFDLFFVRTKDGKETDFLITRDKKPWLLVEAKISSGDINPHHLTQAKHLGEIPFVQIVYEKDIVKKLSRNSFIISANRFF